ncbi:unnamed protein product [Rotaria sp. Silwood1]|nr:unnamed protein product [Rotaria sp. Silwood1]
MENSYNQSTLETLPDEILLEICKYLLCSDILFSFHGLNHRITRMFTQYRHHIALYKTSLAQSDYLCVNLLPKIGCEVRSLLIDCCFSVLQHDLFIKYFGKKMPTIFPNLERIGLVSYQYNQLMAFLDSLHDLNHLTEIRLYGLFSIRSVDQPTAVRSLFRANNNQLTTILIDDQSRSLHFRSIDCYLNILRLRINLKTTADLPYLFHAVPNVQYLDVIIDEHGSSWTYFDELKLSPLLHLTHFQLTSTKQLWMLEELLELFVQLPIVQHLSLFLFTDDRRLIEGDTILSSLSSTVQQFDYAINFSHKMSSDLVGKIIASWPPSHPVTCFYHDTLLFIHTLPWRCTRITFPAFINKISSRGVNNITGYYNSVNQLNLTIDENFTVIKSLETIFQCHQMREIYIIVKDTDNVVKGMYIEQNKSIMYKSDYKKAVKPMKKI